MRVQLSRIEVEWGDYLKAMHKEYLKEVARLEGIPPDELLSQYERELAASPSSTAVKGLWLDKEKQEQLVRGFCLSCCAVCMGVCVACSRSTRPLCFLQWLAVGLRHPLVVLPPPRFLCPAPGEARPHPPPCQQSDLPGPASQLQCDDSCMIYENLTKLPVR
jgi:hypothetical protein